MLPQLHIKSVRFDYRSIFRRMGVLIRGLPCMLCEQLSTSEMGFSTRFLRKLDERKNLLIIIEPVGVALSCHSVERRLCGCSSVVERHVANVNVEGSNPFTRSRFIFRWVSSLLRCRTPTSDCPYEQLQTGYEPVLLIQGQPLTPDSFRLRDRPSVSIFMSPEFTSSP